MKILLTSIVKDDSEAEQFERMLQSFMPHVDGLAVFMTGVSGQFTKLIEIVKKYKGYYIKGDPQSHPKMYSHDENGIFFSNFSYARTTLFDFADTLEGYDWYTWADADDVLVNAHELRPAAEQALKAKIDCVFMTYWYSVRMRKDGSFNYNDVQIDHDRERLLKPKLFRWTSRIHEVAVPKDANYKPVISMYNYAEKDKRHLAWAHITSREKSTDNLMRNMRILEMQAKEEQNKDPRTLYYIAKTCYDLNTKESNARALELLSTYREMSGWAEERSNSWEYTANLHARAGNHNAAINSLFQAAQEFPNRHMIYLLLSREYAELSLFSESDFWLEVALKMDPPQTRTTIGNPLEIKFMAASMKYNQAIRNLKIDDAIFWMEKRLEFGGMEDDGMLKTLKESKAMNDAAKNVVLYANWLKETKHDDLIPNLLSALPYDLGRERFAFALQNEVTKGKKWSKKSIVYLASWGMSHFEKWSPKNLDSGIGGSETAVIELCKRWAKDGFDVWVFGDPRDDAGDYDGVHYRPWYELNYKDEFDTLILWRSPHLLDKDLKANKLYMDLHDVASNLDWTPERVKRVNKVFFKSKYHRSMVPNLPDEKVEIISNGINI